MKRTTKCLAWILLSFIFVIICIGYASVVDILSVTGTATVESKPFEGVYISAVELYSESNAKDVAHSYQKPTNFSVTANASRSGGTITYKITVHNNTNVTYWYIGQEYVKEFESNSQIGQGHGITVTTKDHVSDSSSTFNSSDWVPPNTYRDFYVTYYFGSDALSYTSTLINFSFGIKIDAIHDKFVTVLNDTAVGGGYEYLSGEFDDKYAETGSNVLSNVGSEAEIFNNLFGSNLTVNMNGQELPATIVVCRENVDNKSTGDNYSGSNAPSGCEYTVYISVDDLSTANGKATVYAVSYTYSNGQWYQIGQLYEGTANVITDYDTATQGNQGSFNVSTWIASPKKYEVANGITYLVGQEQGDQYDKLKTLKEIMSTNDQDIFNDIDNTRILKTVYDIVYNSANKDKAGYDNLKQAFENAAPFYNIYNNGQEVKVKRNCTRAEIIPYILKIQNALDYYNQVKE